MHIYTKLFTRCILYEVKDRLCKPPCYEALASLAKLVDRSCVVYDVYFEESRAKIIRKVRFLCHPDKFDASKKSEATECFQKLQLFVDECIKVGSSKSKPWNNRVSNKKASWKKVQVSKVRKPRKKMQYWTPEETSALVRACKVYPRGLKARWVEIARNVPELKNRTNIQVRDYYHAMMKKGFIVDGN